jgi:hypothetical protein
MVGKKISLMQYNGTATSAACHGNWSGYGCYNGVSVEAQISSVQSDSQLTMSKSAGFDETNGAGWFIGSDDSSAIANALNQAKSNGESLVFPGNYSGLVYTAVNPASNTSIKCASGATLWNPHMTTGQTTIFKVTNTGFSIDNCTLNGTESSTRQWYDPEREYDVQLQLFTGSGSVRTDITRNHFHRSWGTYVIGTSGAAGAVITGNSLDTCAYYGVQLNKTKTGSVPTQVKDNSFVDCNYGSEDGGPNPAGSNSEQQIMNNTFRIGPNGGTGYYRSQSTVGGGSHGALFIDSGLYASGSTPNPGQYSGVTVSGNDMRGPGVRFMVADDCVSNPWGASVHDNVCTDGCECTN